MSLTWKKRTSDDITIIPSCNVHIVEFVRRFIETVEASQKIVNALNLARWFALCTSNRSKLERCSNLCPKSAEQPKLETISLHSQHIPKSNQELKPLTPPVHYTLRGPVSVLIQILPAKGGLHPTLLESPSTCGSWGGPTEIEGGYTWNSLETYLTSSETFTQVPLRQKLFLLLQIESRQKPTKHT